MSSGSSKNTVLYACDCASCKGTLFYCYATVRRHRSIFGVAQASLRKEDLGVSGSTREASVAGDVGFVSGLWDLFENDTCIH